MRTGVILSGVIAICLYSIFGAVLMNDWAVTAASELPLAATINEMQKAEQNYSQNGGILFAALGMLLALGWGFLTLSRRSGIATWGALAAWAGIIAMGTPAYFALSFGNMNSIGDTFYDWNADAAFALEMPLYVVSGIAALVAVAALAIGLRTSRR